MQSETTKIARSEGVLSRVLDGEAVLLDTEGGAYFGLNAVGTRVWELIGEAGATEAALMTALLREFDVGPDVLARDLADLLRLHIRREESVVLDVAARVLNHDELSAMAVGLDAWRNAHPETRAPEGR